MKGQLAHQDKKSLSMGRNLLAFTWFLICIITQLHEVADAAFKYIDVTCVVENGNYTEGSVYEQNLDVLLSDLSSQGATRAFYNSTVGEVPNKIYGLYQCRGDVTQEDCAGCIQDASQKILLGCPLVAEVVVWYYECMLRYANHSIFSVSETFPGISIYGRLNVSNYNAFAPVLAKTLKSVIEKAARLSARGYFATESANFTSLFDEIYSLAQCTPDITEFDCRNCLTTRKSIMTNLYNGSVRVASFFPSCQLRYDTTKKFYRDVSSDPLALPPSNAPSPSSTGAPVEEAPGNKQPESGLKPPIIAAIVAGAVGLAIVLAGGVWFCLRHRQPPSPKPSPPNPTPHQQPSLPPPPPLLPPFADPRYEFVQYDLATLRDATNNFSTDQKLGEGGFGVVYLGILRSGEQVAIKKLHPRNARQDTNEFMSEAEIVAKLQHRSLVKLLGSCSEGYEKLLVFEFLPNGSLDHYLFDKTERTLLDWAKRYNIIMEVAKGIQYLHVDSRIRIIHRDLKPHNILLDKYLDPKIADFGMARFLERGRNLANTCRPIGTRGYMAPEYMLTGEYSEKTDVYSFGIIILELVSGQNNGELFRSPQTDDLPILAWSRWNVGRPLDIMDDTMYYNNYLKSEVKRCIHIALLCVQQNPIRRPTIQDVMLMLNGSITPPQPTSPAMSSQNFNASVSSEDDGGNSAQSAARQHMDIERDLYPR